MLAAMAHAGAAIKGDSQKMAAGIEQKSEAGALAYWFDIAPETTGDWLHWYLTDHMPSRVGTAFVSGRCYEALHGPASHMVLFQATSPEALLAPSYMALLKQVSDADRARRGWYSNTVRVTCRVAMRAGSGTGGVLGVARILNARAPAEDIQRCLMEDVVPALAAAPGIGSVWLMVNEPTIRARMDAGRVTGHSDGSADWAVLVEGGHDRDVAAALEGLAGRASWRDLKLGDAVTFGRFRLLYTMTKSDL